MNLFQMKFYYLVRFAVFGLVWVHTVSISAANPIEEVLALGPIPIKSWTGFYDKGHDKAALQNLVNHLATSGLPSSGAKQNLLGAEYDWQVRQTVAAITPGSGTKSATLLSFNLETIRYTKGNLAFTWPGKIHLFLNQSPIEAKTGDEGVHHFPISLPTGSYQILAFVSGESGTLGIQWQGEEETLRVGFHLEPQARVSATQPFHTKTVNQLQLSPDGKWLAIGERGWDEANEAWLRQLEIRNLKNGDRRHSWIKDVPSQLRWRPDSKAFAMKIGDDFWVQSLEDGQAKRILAGVKKVGLVGWHPSGDSLLVTLPKDGDKDPKGVKRYRALEDRWRGWRDTQQIGLLHIGSGILQTLTQEPFGANYEDVDAQGEFLLYSTSPPRYDKPPHQNTVLKRLNLATCEATKLGDFLTFNRAKFVSGGYYISAGPSAFNNSGNALPGQAIANDYDTQLYFWDGIQAEATCYTKYFDPSIVNFEIMASGDLLLHTIEDDQQTLHVLQTERQIFRSMKTGVEIVERITISKTKKTKIAFTGTSATSSQKVMTMTQSEAAKEWYDPASDGYSQTFFGEVKPWNFTNQDGFEIIGRYYTPPGFSPDNRYPLIVYYYGGTVPVNRQFTGRYPFNLWAANGYVVYVLQPSGTIGMGQQFSALHVNAWGQKTAADIVTGTGQFIQAHPFIDGQRVGCLGASYGGFMTMYLLTKTAFFKAAISHAGISDLSGYWGEGWWGYAYSGIASRGSFPWNNPELYTESSPLFHADQITTPLLLLHGDSDTNVPPGQSHNMYTALKLLNREVEFITFDGQDHHILNPKQRLIWWDTLLAWFDKNLKDQPQWWEALYPDND